MQLLQDHIVMMQSMSSSPYSEMFQARISNWENKLCLTQEVLENWQLCQSKWLYLEPIFSCNHIKKQIPLESKRYQDMEHIWSTIMNSAKTNPKLIQLCPDFRLLDSLRKCGTLLEQVSLFSIITCLSYLYIHHVLFLKRRLKFEIHKYYSYHSIIY